MDGTTNLTTTALSRRHCTTTTTMPQAHDRPKTVAGSATTAPPTHQCSTPGPLANRHHHGRHGTCRRRHRRRRDSNHGSHCGCPPGPPGARTPRHKGTDPAARAQIQPPWTESGTAGRRQATATADGAPPHHVMLLPPGEKPATEGAGAARPRRMEPAAPPPRSPPGREPPPPMREAYL
jgi:hypothetical protein